MMQQKYFWVLLTMLLTPALVGAICLLVPFSAGIYVFLGVMVCQTLLAMTYFKAVLLQPIQQLEDIFHAILDDQHPEIPDFQAPWHLISKRLKSLVVFLRINKRGMEDRVILLEEEKQKALDGLQPIAQIEEILQGILTGQQPDVPDFESPWHLVGKHLKSLLFFLRISRQNIEDREMLLHENVQVDEILKPIAQIEDILQAILKNQEPDIPDFETPWDVIGKQLKSLIFFVRISQRSMNDREALLEEEKKKTKEEKEKALSAHNTLQELNEIRGELSGILNSDDMCVDLVNRAVSKLSAGKGFVLKFDNAHQQAVIVTAFNTNKLKTGDVLPMTEIAHHLDTLQKQSVIQYETPGKLYGESYESLLCGASFTDESIQEMWGLVCLMDKEIRGGGVHIFSKEDTNIFTSMISRISQELVKARYFELATVDSLSKLYVRRYFDRRMEDEIKRSQRSKFEMSLLMIDIDHFKRFNDTYGHLIGDEVIQLVARTLQAEVRRQIDLVGRYGGEEMVVLLPEIPMEKAKIAAERIRKRVEEIEIPSLSDVKVTVSIGIATYPHNGSDIRSLMKFADMGLYQAKESGRNRVCVAPEPQPA